MSPLIEPAELAQLLAADDPPVVADVRWTLGKTTGRAAFEAGHLPGAQWVDLERELSAAPGVGGRHPLPTVETFITAMRRIGVWQHGRVVVCDADSSLAAARLWWLLTDFAFERVTVLNGGVKAWADAGLPLEEGPAASVEPGDFNGRPGLRPQVSGDELWAALQAGTAPLVVDVRAAERYAGEVEPIDPVAGHVPGAVNAPSMDSTDADGRFLAAATLRDRFADLGIDAESVLYCGSGITAAHSLLAMEVAGIPGAAIYPGSWSDWIRDERRGVATGSNP